MPSRNIVKIDLEDTYYHIYARGASKKPIFIDELDYSYFLHLLQRYLSLKEIKDNKGAIYKKLYDDVELLAYCLVKNHFHLLVYQVHMGAMQSLMRRVMTGYSAYFNKKYKMSGSLFESRYKASRIDNNEHLTHISRYIHLNPEHWENYEYSSIKNYLNMNEEDWLNSKRILNLFNSIKEYRKFISEYKTRHDELEYIKDELVGY